MLSAATAVVLTGCATTPPNASSTPQTSASATVGDTSNYEPTVFAPTPTGLAGLGVTVSGPPHYKDITADIQKGMDGDGQKVVGAWSNETGTIIAVRIADAGGDLKAFVDSWVQAMDADGDYRITKQRPTKIGGVDGTVLDMTHKDTGQKDIALIAVQPTFALVITGPSESADALRTVAQNVRFG